MQGLYGSHTVHMSARPAREIEGVEPWGSGLRETFTFANCLLTATSVGIWLGLPLKPAPYCNLHFHSPKGILLCTNPLVLFY